MLKKQTEKQMLNLVELIDSVKRDQIRTIAWIASPSGREFSESEAADIFEGFDCWLEELE